MHEVEREVRKESPNGWYTQPFSQGNWDKYWNNRIDAVWKVDVTECDGTYRGPYGPEIVHGVLAYRKQLGLPDVIFDERNRDKRL